MEHARYHLVFEGFKADANKTAVSFTLKDQLNLDDGQLADMMAGRRTVLKENLDKEAAMKLGRELSKAGLVIKAQALAVNQKNSPEEVRKHLMNGGLDQYFASKYRHPEDELDTRMSLLILASFALLTYIILPIIGLMTIFPILSFQIWSNQPIAALVQMVIGLIFFAPAIWLWPKPVKVEGIDLENDTEELLHAFTQNIATHLDAPRISRTVLVESPVLALHQTPLQWLKGETTLEIGLPLLEALNMAQFAGLLAMRLTPLTSTFYSKSWGLFIQWYNALRARYKPWAMLLNNWVLPMHEHQNTRGMLIAREIVGFQEAQRLQRIEKRFNQLNRDWPEFVEYCQNLRIRGTAWSDLVAREVQTEKKQDEVQALFRIESPALWILSTTDGYQKLFAKQSDGPIYSMPGAQLWQQFQRFVPLQERFSELLVRPEALVPPTEAQSKKKGLNAILLNKQANDVLNVQKLMIEQALGMHEKPKKIKDLQKVTAKWRGNSANFWPEGFLQHKHFPLAKSVFLSMQTLQQISLWNIDDKLIPAGKHAMRDQQIVSLYKKWLEQIQKLPALPLVPSESKKLTDQIEKGLGQKRISDLSADEIIIHHRHWMKFLVIYWTFIAGQIMKPKTFADEVAENA
jgi:hypothetical protein